MSKTGLEMESGEKDPEGREIASFECRASGSSGSTSMTILPGSIAVFAAIVSNLSEGNWLLLIFVLVALLPLLAPLIASLYPRTKTTCTIKENGIRLKAIKPSNAKARFHPWRKLARFSTKAMGMKGGRIYIYPKGAFGIFRRETIETQNMKDYSLLFNYVSSRVGLY
ncbi:MAG: hypothetical protein HXS50_04530 [Theionarchaea archaeon]|nr:hypothetical protein [Theionarchaea archaeon]